MITKFMFAKDLPQEIPIFPLGGVLLLPGGLLPLNIFEPRYLAMIDDALKTDRLIGMIQSRNHDGDNVKDQPRPLYDVGCAGRITEFSETGDGRYLISLQGVARFRIAKELEQVSGYRRIIPDWSAFESDLDDQSCVDIDRDLLVGLLQTYFKAQGLDCDWNAIDLAPNDTLLTCLSMICPFENTEKQALIEAPTCADRATLLMSILEMAVHGHHEGENGKLHH